MPDPFLRVRHFMHPDPVMVEPGRPIREVLGVMNDRRIGAVVVVDTDRSLLGIFTERDLLKRVTAADPGWRDYPVSMWMSPRPHQIGPEAGWEDVTATMERHSVRHLPVVEGGRVIGIVSALCFYTDGVIETRDEIGDTFGADRLTACLEADGLGDAEAIMHHVLASQREFRGSQPLSDDVTLVVAGLEV